MQCCNTALLHYKLKNIAIPAYNTPISRCYTANLHIFFDIIVLCRRYYCKFMLILSGEITKSGARYVTTG